MITLGIPTLNRYDLLERAILSAEKGNMKPDKYIIIDNGDKFFMNDFYISLRDRLQVLRYGSNMGVAGSWNKIIQNSSDIRIISNDDVVFFDDTIELLVNNIYENTVTFPAGMPAANAFSCFLITDQVIKTVGLFDEKISPSYAYYEDNDYARRLILAGMTLRGVSNCRLEHSPSSTVQGLEKTMVNKHHEKFKTAQRNYVKKWGGLPGEEKLTTPREL